MITDFLLPVSCKSTQGAFLIIFNWHNDKTAAIEKSGLLPNVQLRVCTFSFRRKIPALSNSIPDRALLLL